MSVQVVPLVEYCQAPFPEDRPVMAMPLAAPESTSLTGRDSSAETWVLLLLTASSLMVVRLLAPLRTGASLMAVTVRLAVPPLLEKAVVPPRVVVLTLVPAVPEVWSHT